MRTNVIATLLAAAILSACVPFPVYKTLQPSARIVVLGERSQPIANAEAILVSNAYPYGLEKRREVKLTKADGTAVFEPLREWRTESLMIHGAEVFFWNWCVRKEGYVTYFTQYGSAAKFQDDLVVPLELGASMPCPKTFH